MTDNREYFILPFSKRKLIRRKGESRVDFNQRKARARVADWNRYRNKREAAMMKAGRIEHPLKKFARVWEMPDNSGTVDMRPSDNGRT